MPYQAHVSVVVSNCLVLVLVANILSIVYNWGRVKRFDRTLVLGWELEWMLVREGFEWSQRECFERSKRDRTLSEFKRRTIVMETVAEISIISSRVREKKLKRNRLYFEINLSLLGFLY